MWLKDPKTGEKSASLTFFASGFAVACLKLIASGLVIGSANLGTFTGSDFAAVVASLGAIYAWRKQTDSKE